MGQRTINKGAQLMSMTNLTGSKLVLSNVTLGPGEAKTQIPASDWLGDSDRANELQALVAAGSLQVTLNVLLDSADLLSLSGVENIITALPVHADADRPAVADVPIGYTIFNTGDVTLNVSDGTNWIDVTTGLST